MVVLPVLSAGVLTGAAVAWAAGRWPVIEAPRVSGATIVHQVPRHPGLVSFLRHRYNPKTETGVALTAATVVAGAAVVGIGVVFTLVRQKLGVQSVDAFLARYASTNDTEFSTSLLRSISEFGGTRGVITLSLAATLVELKRRPSWSLPAFMTLVVGGQFALSNAIKYLVERARPDINPLTGFAGTSFPSGHASAAAASLAAIALITSRGRSRRVKLVVASIAAGLAVAVAGTRVMLGVHWFTDVIAGLFLGWGWFALCSIAFGGQLLQFGVPAATAQNVAELVPEVQQGGT